MLRRYASLPASVITSQKTTRVTKFVNARAISLPIFETGDAKPLRAKMPFNITALHAGLHTAVATYPILQAMCAGEACRPRVRQWQSARRLVAYAPVVHLATRLPLAHFVLAKESHCVKVLPMFRE